MDIDPKLKNADLGTDDELWPILSDKDARQLMDLVKYGSKQQARDFLNAKLDGVVDQIETEAREEASEVARAKRDQRYVDSLSADKFAKKYLSLTEFTPRARQQWESAFTALRNARPEYLDGEKNRERIINLVWTEWNLPPSAGVFIEAFERLKALGNLELDETRGSFIHNGTLLRVG